MILSYLFFLPFLARTRALIPPKCVPPFLLFIFPSLFSLFFLSCSFFPPPTYLLPLIPSSFVPFSLLSFVVPGYGDHFFALYTLHLRKFRRSFPSVLLRSLFFSFFLSFSPLPCFSCPIVLAFSASRHCTFNSKTFLPPLSFRLTMLDDRPFVLLHRIYPPICNIS